MEYSDCEPTSLKSGTSEALKNHMLPLHQTQESESLFSEPLSEDTKKITLLNNIDVIITPLSLLTYLRSIKEIELYYYLFNQVSIVKIIDNKVEIARANAEKGLNIRLAEILFTWTGKKWNVIITDVPDEPNLKEKMKIKFMESEEWKMLENHFGGQATLTDIILD